MGAPLLCWLGLFGCLLRFGGLQRLGRRHDLLRYFVAELGIPGAIMESAKNAFRVGTFEVRNSLREFLERVVARVPGSRLGRDELQTHRRIFAEHPAQRV